MVWNIVQGSQPERPAEVEVGKTHTFIRKDIEQVTTEDEMSGQTLTYWLYSEAKLPNSETSEIVKAVQEASAEKIQANADELESQAEAIMELAAIIGGDE